MSGTLGGNEIMELRSSGGIKGSLNGSQTAVPPQQLFHQTYIQIMHFTNLLAFAGASILGLSGVQAYSNFGASCRNTALRGSILSADCRSRNGIYGGATIDLSSCVVNTNASLRCQSNGQFFKSCSNCGVSGATLSCRCNPGPRDTSLDLNQCVGNEDGRLVC
ncbi:hypothetical protein CTheo_7117 [Ceratobasidium theobromae]|uniref:Cyanovirin-N domain-containing protein n=1 Tax=Ceratobasidium theobromae TaxID=1582974 RepID=A0A5N5QDB4_9AGAM|nr:hypothetical protein CTheo_7117 [Ceratobasidium theobromae]